MELNNLKGISKIGLIILLSIISICLISIVFGTIDSITLNSPPNQTATTDTTPDSNFTAVSDTNTTFSCELFIDDTGYGANDSVSNNTATIITANSSLSDGSYNWYINCTDVNGTSKSEERVITIDTTNPALNFVPPTEPNNTAIDRNWTEANITIDELNLDTFKFNWNTTDYTFYDDSLILGMNLNNNSAIGENSTKAVDISKYGNDGTLENGTSWTTSGKFGSALSFDGVDDYVDCGDTADLEFASGQSFSFSFWFKGTGHSSSQDGIITKGYGAGDNDLTPWYLEYYENDGTIALFLRDSGGTSSHTSGTVAIDDGNWHFITAVYDAGAGEIRNYVDTELDTTTTGVPEDAYGTNAGIFVLMDHLERYTQGSLDEVRIYNRALSTEEIKMHYQSEFSKFNSTQYRFYDNVTDSDGTYTYYGWANDTASNTGNTETREITLDTTPPEIQFVPPTTETGNQTETWIAANLTTSDPNLDTLILSLYNSTGLYQENTTSDTQIYINYTGLPDDTYYLNATANDTLGNTNKTETRTIEIDTTAPTVSITYPDSDSTVDNYIINGTSTDSNLDYTNISIKQGGTIINSTTNSSENWEVNLYAPDGVYNITATAYDGAGNSNTTTNTNITIDTPPEIQFVTPTTETGNQTETWISANVTGSDALNFDTLTLSLYNSTGLYQENKTSDTQIYINYTSLPEDTYYLNATANDTAGNENQTETRTINVDTTNPEISYNPNTDESGAYDKDWIFINVTASDTNKDSVKLNWNGTNETFDNQSGDVYWENKTSLADGNYTFYASINDTAGNTNQTAEREVKITEWTISVYETDNSSDKSWNINDIPLNFQYYCYAGVDGSCNSSLADDGDGSTCNFTIENNGSSTVDVLMYALGDYSSSYYICSSSDSTTDGDDSSCQDPPATGDNGADNIQIYNSSTWFNVSSKIHDGDAYGMAIACDLPANTNLSDIDFQVRVPDGVAPSSYSATLQFVAYSDISDCSVGSYFVP